LTFSKQFDTAPVVTTNIRGTERIYCVYATNVTTTGFDYLKKWLYNNAIYNATAEKFDWIAMEINNY
jgi:hypothetical protein